MFTSKTVQYRKEKAAASRRHAGIDHRLNSHMRAVSMINAVRTCSSGGVNRNRKSDLLINDEADISNGL